MIFNQIVSWFNAAVAGLIGVLPAPVSVSGWLDWISAGAAAMEDSVGSLGVVFPTNLLGSAIGVWLICYGYWFSLRAVRVAMGFLSKG